MKTALLLGAAGSAVFAFYRAYRQAKLHNGLDQLLAEGAVILDVRTPWAYKDGYLASSVNIPLSRLRDEPLPLDKEQVYITCCSLGLRSVKAVDMLRTRGFPYVYNSGVWTELKKHRQLKPTADR